MNRGAISLAVIIVLLIIGLREIWCTTSRLVRPLLVRAGMAKPLLYDRLGGSFAIASLVDYFSEEILKSPLVGLNSPNPQLRAWSQLQSETRMPGLKFMRTLWVCDLTGGPQ